MLPSLKYPLFLLVLGIGLSSEAKATHTPTFQESFQDSLTWAKEQAAKIKDQIAAVDLSPSIAPPSEEEDDRDADHPREGNRVCRAVVGKLPCARKPRNMEKSKEAKKLPAAQNSKGQRDIKKPPFSSSRRALVKPSQHPLPSVSRASPPPLFPGKLLVFISLSLPEASLKTFCREADQYQAVLVLRGLVNDSFKETAAVLQHLELSLEIDPEAFERYHIHQVPTFVWVDEKGQERVRLKGNVTLSFVWQKFQDSLL